MPTFPYTFPDLTDLTDETQIYTQRRSNSDDPADQKFNMGQVVAYVAAQLSVLSSLGTYSSDEEAEQNGVPVGGFYDLSSSNIYGLPEGLLKKRTT